jgi:oligopeptidase B
MDSEHRPNRLYMHVLGTSQEEDICYFQEDDSRYNLGVGKSASDRFLFIGMSSPRTVSPSIIVISDVAVSCS